LYRSFTAFFVGGVLFTNMLAVYYC